MRYVEPVRWHPLSIALGFGLAAVVGIAVLQVVELGSGPGVLDVTELQVVDGRGRVLARLGVDARPDGDGEGGGAGLWLADDLGEERASLRVDRDAGDDETSVRLSLLDRWGEPSVVLEHDDWRQHGDSTGLQLGEARLGYGGGMSGTGSWLLLPGDGGSLELGTQWEGPRVLFRAAPPASDGHPGGNSVIYLGRENLSGFPAGSLVLQMLHGGGELALCMREDGEVTVDLESAGGEPVRLGP